MHTELLVFTGDKQGQRLQDSSCEETCFFELPLLGTVSLSLDVTERCFIMALRRERDDLGCAETVLQEQDGHPGMEEREDRDGEWI